MFLELADLLTCPRCGPGHGLVLLVQEVDERRVRSGWLGCPDCQAYYPVTEGVPDLRLNPEPTAGRREPLRDDDLALKIVALSGLAEEQGYLLLGERVAHAAASVVELAPELELIAMAAAPPDCKGEQPGVSRILCDIRFPLVEYRLRGAAVAPGGDWELVAAAAKRVAAGGRLVLFDAGEADLEEVERCGLTLVASEGGTAVAERKTEPALGL